MISRSDADMYVVAIAIRPGSSTTTRRERFTLVTTPSTPYSGPVLTLTFCPSRILEETISRYNASSAIMRLTLIKSSIALSGTIIGLRVALSHIYLTGQASPRPVIYASRASFQSSRSTGWTLPEQMSQIRPPQSLAELPLAPVCYPYRIPLHSAKIIIKRVLCNGREQKTTFKRGNQMTEQQQLVIRL